MTKKLFQKASTLSMLDLCIGLLPTVSKGLHDAHIFSQVVKLELSGHYRRHYWTSGSGRASDITCRDQ
jgi:hypothetical protein